MKILEKLKMWWILKRIFPFNRKKSSPSDSLKGTFQRNEAEDEADGLRSNLEERQSLLRPTFDDFSSQASDTVSNRSYGEDEYFSGSFNSPKAKCKINFTKIIQSGLKF